MQDPNNYWEQLERLEKLIRASELKAGVIFSFHSLILGLFVDRLEYFEKLFEAHVIFGALVGLWLLTVLISVYFSFKCFMPQIELKYPKNVFFFRDAASGFGNIEEYTQKLIDICGSEDELYSQLGQQIHVESVIIKKKFESVAKSLKFFGISFFLVMAILIIWLAML